MSYVILTVALLFVVFLIIAFVVLIVAYVKYRAAKALTQELQKNIPGLAKWLGK